MPQDWFAQHAPSSGDWFAANAPSAIPPNPSDSIPAAKPPVPTELQGPAPSRIAQIIQNLPQSTVNAIMHPTFPGMPGAEHDIPTGKSFADDQQDTVGRELAATGRFLRHPIDTTVNAFTDDPVGTALTAAQLGKGAVESAPAVADAVTSAAPKVVAVAKGVRSVVGDAASAGGKDIAVGTGKVATAGALAKMGGPGWIGAYQLGRSGFRQFGEGVKNAYAAGKQTLEDLQAPPSVEVTHSVSWEKPPEGGDPTQADASAPTPDLSVDGVPFDKLPATLQKVILADIEKQKMGAPTAPSAPPVTPHSTPPPDLAPPPSVEQTPEAPSAPPAPQPPVSAPPSVKPRTQSQIIDDELAAGIDPRTGQPKTGPLAQQSQPNPPPPPPLPQPIVTGKGPKPPAAFLDDQSTGIQNEFHSANSSAVANRIAQYLHKNGVKSAELNSLAKLDPPAYSALWDKAGQIPGVSNQAGYAPSFETQQRALFELQRLEVSGRLARKLAPPPSAPPKIPAKISGNLEPGFPGSPEIPRNPYV